MAISVEKLREEVTRVVNCETQYSEVIKNKYVTKATNLVKRFFPYKQGQAFIQKEGESLYLTEEGIKYILDGTAEGFQIDFENAGNVGDMIFRFLQEAVKNLQSQRENT